MFITSYRLYIIIESISLVIIIRVFIIQKKKETKKEKCKLAKEKSWFNNLLYVFLYERS